MDRTKSTPAPIFNHRKRPRQAVIADPLETKISNNKFNDLMPVGGFGAAGNQNANQGFQRFSSMKNDTSKQQRIQPQNDNRNMGNNQYQYGRASGNIPNGYSGTNRGNPYQQSDPQGNNQSRPSSNNQSYMNKFSSNQQSSSPYGQAASTFQRSSSNFHNGGMEKKGWGQQGSNSIVMGNSYKPTPKPTMQNYDRNYQSRAQNNQKLQPHTMASQSNNRYQSFGQQNNSGYNTQGGNVQIYARNQQQQYPTMNQQSFNSQRSQSLNQGYTQRQPINMAGDGGFSMEKSQPTGSVFSHQTQVYHGNQTQPANSQSIKVKPKQTKKKIDPSLHVITLPISRIHYWSKYRDNINMLFEVFGIIDSAVVWDSSGTHKEFILRDEQQHMKCLFFEIDRSLPKLTRGQWHRAVGTYDIKKGHLKCVSVRPASVEEKNYGQQQAERNNEIMKRMTEHLPEQ